MNQTRPILKSQYLEKCIPFQLKTVGELYIRTETESLQLVILKENRTGFTKKYKDFDGHASFAPSIMSPPRPNKEQSMMVATQGKKKNRTNNNFHQVILQYGAHVTAYI